MRPLTLAGRLIAIASIAILPLAIVCAFALNALLQGQNSQARVSTLGVVRALATSVESEFRLSASALQALAFTEPLGATDAVGLKEARDLTSDVRTSHPEWRTVLLLETSGKLLFSTNDSDNGAPAVWAVDKHSLDEAVNGAKITVGPMASGPDGTQAFPILVPVFRNENVERVLVAVVRPEAITQVLARQRVPDGWTVSVFDSKLSRVARSRNDDQVRGTPPSVTLQAIIRSMGDETQIVGDSTNIDGTRVQAAVAKLESTGWIVALGASVSTAERTARRTIVAYGGSLLLSLWLGVFTAWRMSRAIARPMAQLRDSADALGRGEGFDIEKQGIAEIDGVAVALQAASQQRAQSDADLQVQLELERTARAAAEARAARLADMATAGVAIAEPLDEEGVAAALAGQLVPGFADLCVVDLIDAGEAMGGDDLPVLHRKVLRPAEPKRAHKITQVVGSDAALSPLRDAVLQAMKSSRVVAQDGVDADADNEKARPAPPALAGADFQKLVKTLGVTATRVVPLVARGRSIGALSLMQLDPKHRFEDDEQAMIADLAQRAAIALDNLRRMAAPAG